MSIARRVAVVGAIETGKTSLINQWAGSGFSEEYKSSKFSGARTVGSTLVIDFLGFDHKPMSVSLFKDVQGGLLVFSVADKHSYDVLPEGLKKMREHINGPIILVGNKSDLTRVISNEDALRFAKENNLTYLEVSAKNKEEVDKVFLQLLEKLILDPLIEIHPTELPSMPKLPSTPDLSDLSDDEKLEVKATEVKVEGVKADASEDQEDTSEDEEVDESFSAVAKGLIIADIKLCMEKVGKSRVELKSELMKKCDAAKSIDDIIKALKICGDEAQIDHTKNTGKRLFVLWGPVIWPTCNMKKAADALIEKYDPKLSTLKMGQTA
jgi:GTPase SAR1 family protein